MFLLWRYSWGLLTMYRHVSTMNYKTTCPWVIYWIHWWTDYQWVGSWLWYINGWWWLRNCLCQSCGITILVVSSASWLLVRNGLVWKWAAYPSSIGHQIMGNKPWDSSMLHHVPPCSIFFSTIWWPWWDFYGYPILRKSHVLFCHCWTLCEAFLHVSPIRASFGLYHSPQVEC